MLRRLVTLAIVLIFALVTPSPSAHAKYMDCYPGILLPVRGESYPVCLIDHENQCMYCTVTIPM